MLASYQRFFTFLAFGMPDRPIIIDGNSFSVKVN